MPSEKNRHLEQEISPGTWGTQNVPAELTYIHTYTPIFLWDMEIKGKLCDCDHPGAYRPTSLGLNNLRLGVKVTSLLGAGLRGIRSTTAMGKPRCSGQTTLCRVTTPHGQGKWSKQDLVLDGQELYGGQSQARRKHRKVVSSCTGGCLRGGGLYWTLGGICSWKV